MDACSHFWINEGPRVPLRYGSAPTFVCSNQDCAMWRLGDRWDDGKWRDAADLAREFCDYEEAERLDHLTKGEGRGAGGE